MMCRATITTTTTTTTSASSIWHHDSSSSIISIPSVRFYHGTGPREAVRRRRRRPGQAVAAAMPDDDDDEDPKRRPVARVTKDPVAFERLAKALMDRIHAALVPLAAVNDPFVLTRDVDAEFDHGECIFLDLGPLHGQYTLQVDPEQALVHLQSPISGIVQYRHDDAEDEDGGAWRSVEDGHILEGLLVRDLIRQIKGVPQL